MKQRIAAFLMCVICLLSVVGCGQTKADTNTPSAANQQTVTDGRHQRQGAQTGFGFCTVGLNKDFFAVNGCLCDEHLA
jgi:hypothetical protein